DFPSFTCSLPAHLFHIYPSPKDLSCIAQSLLDVGSRVFDAAGYDECRRNHGRCHDAPADPVLMLLPSSSTFHRFIVPPFVLLYHVGGSNSTCSYFYFTEQQSLCGILPYALRVQPVLAAHACCAGQEPSFESGFPDLSLYFSIHIIRLFYRK